MKVLFIVSAVLLATAQANILSDIGHDVGNIIANPFPFPKQLLQSPSKMNLLSNLNITALVKQLDTTGVDLLNAGINAGKTLISQGIQALALNTANALQGSTREIKLPATLQNVESSLHNVVDTLMGEMKNMFGFLVKGLQGVMDKLSKLEITPEEAISEVDKLVNVHNLVADSFLKTIKDKAEEVISSLTKSKRNAFTNLFTGIGESLTKTFQPVVDGVKTLSIGAGSAIKTGATSLLEQQKQQAKV